MEINLLLQTLNFIRPLSGKLQDRIAECLKEESYPKRYILLKEGDTNRKIYYIVDGLARNYYLNETGRQCTTWFMQHGDFMISVYSFFTQQPSQDTIEVLEESIF